MSEGCFRTGWPEKSKALGPKTKRVRGLSPSLSFSSFIIICPHLNQHPPALPNFHLSLVYIHQGVKEKNKKTMPVLEGLIYFLYKDRWFVFRTRILGLIISQNTPALSHFQSRDTYFAFFLCTLILKSVPLTKNIPIYQNNVSGESRHF